MENSPEQKNDPVKEIDKHVRVLKEKINKFLSGEKPSDVLIIKSHLISEYYLNQILVLKNLFPPQEIDQLNFYEKNKKSFDLQTPNEKNIYERLKKLNKLRNKVGHELEYTLSEFDVDTLGYLTGKDYILIKYDYEKIEDLLRFILIGIVIDLAIHVFGLVSIEKEKS